MEKIFVIDGGYDGLMTVVHGYYYKKWRPKDIVSRNFQRRLDAEYFLVETDTEGAKKVIAAIARKISSQAADICLCAFLSEDPSIFFAIYNFLILGFAMGADITYYRQNPYALKTIDAARAVSREAERMIQFARFTETENGAFYADISPKYNCLPLLAPHFMNRYMNMAWVIHDVKRSTALIYDANECVLTETPKERGVQVTPSSDERLYRDLWKSFFKAITNEQRKNPKLQRSLLPLHYRNRMTEFKD
ncbi:MAG: TIGR03915 family putative DNA repair protein [Clostridiales bacterium]|nr:TIGR03915 family putative DNA repair protein [Clostridiales bacterium]